MNNLSLKSMLLIALIQNLSIMPALTRRETIQDHRAVDEVAFDLSTNAITPQLSREGKSKASRSLANKLTKLRTENGILQERLATALSNSGTAETEVNNLRIAIEAAYRRCAEIELQMVRAQYQHDTTIRDYRDELNKAIDKNCSYARTINSLDLNLEAQERENNALRIQRNFALGGMTIAGCIAFVAFNQKQVAAIAQKATDKAAEAAGRFLCEFAKMIRP